MALVQWCCGASYFLPLISFRDDSSWWKQYIEFDPSIDVDTNELYNNNSIGLLPNNFNVKNPGHKSWCP